MPPKKNPEHLRVIQASLKTTASPRQVTQLIWRLRVRENFDCLVTTELGRQSKKKVTLVRNMLGPEYGVLRMEEYLFAYRKKALEQGKTEYHRITNNWPFLSSWRDTYVAAVWFIIIAGDFSLRLEEAHLPASVEAGTRYTKDPKKAKYVETHKDALEAWGKRLNNRKPEARVIAMGDFNTNFKLKEWRTRTERELDLQCCWRNYNGRQGSHGGRLIDAQFSNMEVVQAYVSDVWEPDVFDHEQIVVDYNPAKIYSKKELQVA